MNFKPSLPMRQSVLLISAAILMSAATQVQAKSTGIDIGRLPSFHAGDGQVVGVKPNLFLIIDNSSAMASKSSNVNDKTPDFNLLQQTSAALIASLPQLEGKVRLGYTTGYRGVEPIAGASCATYKLNGNVKRLFDAGYLSPEVKADLDSNTKYVVGDNDFVFKNAKGEQTGSGFGEIIPRDFSGNYASYIYAWLGGMCPSGGGDKNQGSIVYPPPVTAPPYAELDASKADEYRQAATAAGNPASYPTTNVISNFGTQRSRPMIHMHGEVLKQIGDVDFFSRISKCTNVKCGGKGGLPFLTSTDMKIDPKRWTHTKRPREYDAYADIDPSDGFPSIKPLSCRRNYEIIINSGTYAPPGNLSPNSDIGSSGVTKDLRNYYTWNLPSVKSGIQGINETTFPKDQFYTRMYRYLKPTGNPGIENLPTDANFPNRSYLFGKGILQSYYSDLRSDLENDIKAFYAVKDRHDGPNGSIIPKDWDRKNDTAPWQHLTLFSLGFDKFKSWKKATIYNQNYSNLDPDGGPLEGYFRAIEDGSIEALNAPLADWGRGIYAKKDSYIFRDRSGVQSIIKLPSYPGIDDPLAEMDLAKAGVIGRGGSYMIKDYNSIKKVISTIANRIETAMAQGISGGAISGGGRITASQQAAGGNDSILFTTYLDQENASGNIFAFKNCPLIKQMIPDENGSIVENPDWDKYDCGKRLWNAASALYDDVSSIGSKTIVPVDDSGKLSGARFDWNNLDQKLKAEFSKGGDEALGKARVEWLNGKLQSQLAPAVASKIRARGEILIPNEKEHYKRNPDGTLEKDKSGNVVVADPTNIPNLMGDVVYALPKAVDNRGTLPAAHPLYNQSYIDFLDTTVKNRKPLVLAGSNDGRLYGFSVAKTGKTADEFENAALAFSYIPRQVITKTGDNLVSYTTKNGLERIKGGRADGLVNGPFTVRDAQVNGKWGTYVVGTLGEGGDAIYALDISNGRADPNMFKWEVSGRGYGNIMAEPRIVWLRAKSDINEGKWVVLLPTGYNADTVSLIVLDLADGHELAKINTTAKYSEVGEQNDTKTCQLTPLNSKEAKNENTKELWDKLSNIGELSVPKELTCDNGLGQLTVFDANSDSGADFVFAGDLLGDVWKFDLSGFFDSTGNQASDLNNALKVAYNSPLFIAQTPIKPNKISTRQPITSMITIDDGAYGEGSMLYFGTGRMLNQRERQLKQQESFYGIWDIPRYSEQTNISLSLPLRRNPILTKGARYDFIRYETFVIPSSDVVDKQYSFLKNFKELRGVKRVDHLTSSKYLSFNLEGESNPNDKVVGWIIDFPSENALERVINRAYSFEDNIFFPTFSPKGGTTNESCSPILSGVGGDARFYMVDRLTGGQLDTSPFDFNNDGTQDDKDGVKVRRGDLGNANDDHQNPDSCKSNDPTNCELSLSPAGILIGSGSGDFLSVTGILERSKQATDKYNCDYSRQVVFPSTVDPVTGNPLILSSCNRNRYRVWKQPIIE